MAKDIKHEELISRGISTGNSWSADDCLYYITRITATRVYFYEANKHGKGEGYLKLDKVVRLYDDGRLYKIGLPLEGFQAIY